MNVQPHLLNLSAYINQNLDKDLPLSTLAKRVGLSPFHFHRKFGAYFGESLHQHIKRLRLERAAFALVHGTAPVRQIARESGYKTVSAFSHAFSGFAGESPTRYRTLATSPARSSAPAPVNDSALEPAWIGTLPAQEFVFIRATDRGGDIRRSIVDGIDLVMRMIGPLAPRAADGDGEALECIAATSDVYGFANGNRFRVDVGVDAARVVPERSGLLGHQTLPGGRYARFDLRCRPGEIVGQCGRLSLRRLRDLGETVRLSQYFVRFGAAARNDPEQVADYRLFVPLIG